jgi:putative membrane protein
VSTTPSEPAGDEPGLPPAPTWAAGGAVLSAPRERVAIDEPARTSPLTVVLELAALATLAGSLAVAIAVGVDPAELVQLGLGGLVIVARVVGWWFRTYTVTAGELLLDEGVVQRRHRVVPFSRIQQVELRQQLVARVLGIATVHIETAADAGSTAVTLRALALDRAEALRDHLVAEQHRVRAARADAVAPATSPPSTAPWVVATPRRQLVRLGPGQLLAAGATGTDVVSAAPLLVLGAGIGAVAIATSLDLPALVATPLVVALAGSGAIMLSLLGAARSLVAHWGFELTAVGEDLHLSHGLVDRRQHTMPRHRLQHARVVDNPVRHVLGTAAVHLHSAATPGRGDEQQASIDIPLVRAADVGDLLATVMGSDDFRPPELVPRPAAARRRAITRRTVATALPTALVAAIGWPTGAGVLPFAVLGVPWGVLAHRRAGHALHGPVLAIASGAVAHRLELIPRRRLQSVRTARSPFQRRLDLATLHLDVAGTRRALGVGAPGLMDLSADQATAALHRLTAPPAPG